MKKTFAGGVVLGVVAAVLAFMHLDGDANNLGRVTAHRKPYEYLYLDSGRVDSFLGELNQGQVRSLSRQETESRNASVGLQLDTLGSATASEGRQLTESAVVTKTEADNFYSLLEKLQEGALTTVDASATTLASDLAPAKVPVGSMVRINNTFLNLPPYLAPYPALRYARFESHAKGLGRPSLSKYSLSRYAAGPTAESARLAFIKKVGPNPRLPFFEHRNDVTLVIPARFAYLTGDPSLLSARLTVVGKVTFNTRTDPGGQAFGDGASEDTYLPALLHAPGSFLRQIGVKGRAVTSQRELFNGVSDSLTFPGRMVEIVPVAIYD
jgi:hypothetical protein